MKKFYFLLTVLIFVGLWFLSRSLPQEEIQTLVSQNGYWGIFIFFIITLATYVLAPLSGSPVLFAGFWVFGREITFLSMVAAWVAAIINFWIARKFGRPLVEKFVGKNSIEKIDILTQNYGLVSLFVLRVFQGGIQEFISYGAGLTNMKFVPYLIVSIIGMIPGTFLIYWLAAEVSDPTTFTIITLGFATVASGLYLVGVWMFSKFRKQSDV